jgi:hypothetical protein
VSAVNVLRVFWAMEAVSTSETSVSFCKIARYSTPKDTFLLTCRLEKLKYHLGWSCFSGDLSLWHRAVGPEDCNNKTQIRSKEQVYKEFLFISRFRRKSVAAGGFLLRLCPRLLADPTQLQVCGLPFRLLHATCEARAAICVAWNWILPLRLSDSSQRKLLTRFKLPTLPAT